MYLGDWSRKAGVCSLVLSLSLAVVPAHGSKAPGLQPLRETSWWSQVQRNIAQQEYEITWQEDAPGGGAFHAANRAQNLRCYFRDSGVEIVPRMGEPDWCWGFELVGFGDGASFECVERTEPSSGCECLQYADSGMPIPLSEKPVSPNRRVEYIRPSVIEWYENSEEGLEQGFVISERPRERSSPRGCMVISDSHTGNWPLVLEGQISGGFEAMMEKSGSHVSFMCNGVEVLRYGGLKVIDAEGKKLTSRLALNSDVLAIVIEGEGKYPIYIDPLLTSPSWTAEGNQASAYFGMSVAGAGDVNNDSYSDVIVGAPYYDNGQVNEGRAFVYHGSTFGLSVTPDWTGESNQANAIFGDCVAGAGDVNDDGYSDVIVGATAYSPAGRVYVYLGGASGLGGTHTWTTGGEPDGDCYGRSVACAGDVNGDGCSDVIVGDDCYGSGGFPDDYGRAYVYHGRASGLDSLPAWTADGLHDIDSFGWSVASAGDVNGDTYSDVIVGTYYADTAYVYHGGASGLSVAPDWKAGGTLASFGWCVASAGDVNDDGYSDVTIGDPSCNSVGRTYVYHGSPSGLSTAADWSVDGDQANAYFGHSVAGAGDVNNDGYSDIIVGAHWYTNGETKEGRAFIYRGGASGLEAAAAWTAESDQADALFGSCVSGAGDVNGDGCPDVIVGAPLYINGETDEGGAFVYQGICGSADVPGGPGRTYANVLYQNYPNPFRGLTGTTIQYTVERGGRVEVRIFDAAGRLLGSIASHAKPGDNCVRWDGRAWDGGFLPSGVYFYEIRTGNFTAQKKMILAR